MSAAGFGPTRSIAGRTTIDVVTGAVHRRWTAAIVAVTAAVALAAPVQPAAAAAECVVIGVLGAAPTVSDAVECARPTSPASTFKIPHALIALQTGVIGADTIVPWDGTKHDSTQWQRPHTVVSAIQWSALPFFQRTARLIGRERMREQLAPLSFAADGFDGELTRFWLNGDLVVSPLEQYAFLQRFFAGRLPIDPAHVATVRRALQMPPGQVTNASGSHPFVLAWPRPFVVYAKTGNASVDGERVSWLVGAVEYRGTQHVVVARVRAAGTLEGTAGLEAARRGLDRFKPAR